MLEHLRFLWPAQLLHHMATVVALNSATDIEVLFRHGGGRGLFRPARPEDVGLAKQRQGYSHITHRKQITPNATYTPILPLKTYLMVDMPVDEANIPVDLVYQPGEFFREGRHSRVGRAFTNVAGRVNASRQSLRNTSRRSIAASAAAIGRHVLASVGPKDP